ncbi:MAG: signal recognition particle-docking protein FtsY [Polyangiales bacterium]
MTIVIILSVVAVLIGGFFFMRRSGASDTSPSRELPKGEEHELDSVAEQAAKEVAAKEVAKVAPPEAAQEAPAAAHTPAEEPAAEPSAEEPAEESTEPAEEPAAPLKAHEAVEVSAPSRRATAEEVAALRDGLGTTRRGGFIARLASLFSSKKAIDPSLLEEMEELLITADIGVQATEKILGRLRGAMEAGTIKDGEAAWAALREHAYELLSKPGSGGLTFQKTPTVILVIGVNGVGKTTTIGKLASRLKDEGKTVLLAAGDTFRAAAVLQLQVWGRRVGCEVVKGKERADPGSVIFDAVKKGMEMGADVIIADTAGRLHTKAPLMEELQKVGRTAEKALGRPADEVLLVVDSTTGQNAVQQTALFKEALPISGLVLTKLDGTAKGGVIMGIVDSHGIPVRYIGIGERVEDLKEFEPRAFADALFAPPEEGELGD